MADVLSSILLLVLVFLSAISDWTTKKIPNKVTIPFIIVGPVLLFFSRGLPGLYSGLIGFFIGFLLLLIPYLFGGMGGGDVKLMAAIGSLKGGVFVFTTFFFSAIIGGFIAAIYSIKMIGVKNTSKRFASYIFRPLFKVLYQVTGWHRFLDWFGRLSTYDTSKEHLYIPYAIPIAIGSTIALLDVFPSFL